MKTKQTKVEPITVGPCTYQLCTSSLFFEWYTIEHSTSVFTNKIQVGYCMLYHERVLHITILYHYHYYYFVIIIIMIIIIIMP